MPYQVVRNKIDKINVLLEDPKLAPYVPETVYFTPKNLERMLSTYDLVFVKPNRSKGGERVISIKPDRTGTYQVHYQTNTTSKETLEAVISLIHSIAAGDRFIVQQGIKVLQINNKPIDLRVNVQKPYKRWLVTGMVTKIAAAGKAVTNYSQGGVLTSPEKTLLRAGLKEKDIVKLKNILLSLGQRASVTLNKRYPGLRELGLDVAVDRNARPYILEVNTNPQYNKFFQTYQTIHFYHQIIINRHRL